MLELLAEASFANLSAEMVDKMVLAVESIVAGAAAEFPNVIVDTRHGVANDMQEHLPVEARSNK
eukprot:9470243-Pyramimonas_sp.AAC.1